MLVACDRTQGPALTRILQSSSVSTTDAADHCCQSFTSICFHANNAICSDMAVGLDSISENKAKVSSAMDFGIYVVLLGSVSTKSTGIK